MITVITSNLNNTNLLSATACSIRSQSVKCQWIIIDGGSKDGVEKFYEENCDIITCFISEPDSGIYNAWNKGVKFVHTVWVIFLGAGDVFFDEFTVERCLPLLDSNHLICYGNVQMIDRNGLYQEFFGMVNPSMWEQCRPQTPHHQGVFHNSSIFKSLSFDESYRIGGDSKLVLEVFSISNPYYLNTNVAMMRAGGVSYKLESLSVCLNENRRMVRELMINRHLYKRSIYSDLKLIIKVWCFRMLGKHSLMIIDFYRAITGRRRSSYER